MNQTLTMTRAKAFGHCFLASSIGMAPLNILILIFLGFPFNLGAITTLQFTWLIPAALVSIPFYFLYRRKAQKRYLIISGVVGFLCSLATAFILIMLLLALLLSPY